MPASPALTLPIWFQALLGVIAILGFLGGAWFALFIIWPSIRRQTRLGERIDELIDKAHKKLDVGGQDTTLDTFLRQEKRGINEL